MEGAGNGKFIISAVGVGVFSVYICAGCILVFVAPFLAQRCAQPCKSRIECVPSLYYVLFWSRTYLSRIQYCTGILYGCTKGSVGGSAHWFGSSNVYFHCFICGKNYRYGGRVIYGNVFDPTTNEQTSITGALLQYGVMLILYTTGLHRFLLKALMETFILVPIGGARINTDRLLENLIVF